MKDLKEQILKEYQTSVITRQTYQAIADKVGCTKAYAWSIINQEIKQKNLMLSKIESERENNELSISNLPETGDEV